MAIGVRIGDPTGVTFKKYLANNGALEFVLGVPTYLVGGYNYNYYYDHNNSYYGYNGHKSVFGVAMQAHYLKHFDIRPVDGLQWYVGGGLQLRNYTYDVYYSNWPYNNRETTRVSDLAFGLDVKGGAEYTFSNVPFSVFADLNIFMAASTVHSGVFAQPGIGGRYNF